MVVHLPPELEKSVADLDQAVRRIAEEYPIELEKTPTPPILHHYTDDNGLIGILKSGHLWLTDVFYLNDPSEMKYGVTIATEMLNATAAAGPPEQQIFAADFRRYENRAVENVASYFCLSFSTKGNDLEQWRGYGNNGRGYSIGFDGPKLETAFCLPNGVRLLEHITFPVSYDEHRMRAIFQRLINETLPFISVPKTMSLSNATIERYFRNLRIALAFSIYHTSLFFKHPAYFNEQEFRFMKINAFDNPPNNLQFRPKPDMLLRYIEFDWKTSAPGALKQVIVGPGNDPQIGGRFAFDCLRAFFNTPPAPVNVVLSGIPYRPG